MIWMGKINYGFDEKRPTIEYFIFKSLLNRKNKNIRNKQFYFALRKKNIEESHKKKFSKISEKFIDKKNHNEVI